MGLKGIFLPGIHLIRLLRYPRCQYGLAFHTTHFIIILRFGDCTHIYHVFCFYNRSIRKMSYQDNRQVIANYFNWWKHIFILQFFAHLVNACLFCLFCQHHCLHIFMHIVCFGSNCTSIMHGYYYHQDDMCRVYQSVLLKVAASSYRKKCNDVYCLLYWRHINRITLKTTVMILFFIRCQPLTMLLVPIMVAYIL